MKICPNCGAENTDAAAFCRECGAKLSQKEKRFCMYCGAEVNENDIFCPECGRKVSGEAAAENGTADFPQDAGQEDYRTESYENTDSGYAEYSNDRSGDDAGDYHDSGYEDEFYGDPRDDFSGNGQQRDSDRESYADDYESGYKDDYSDSGGGNDRKSPGLIIGTVVAAALAAVIVVAALAWNGVIDLPFGSHSDNSSATATAGSDTEDVSADSALSDSSESEGVKTDSADGEDSGDKSGDASGGQNFLMPGEEDTSGSNAQQNDLDQNSSGDNAGTAQDAQSVTGRSFYGGHAATDGQIFTDSSTRELTASEVGALDQYSIQDAINEIYAREGGIFEKVPELNTYYSQTSWYHGTTPVSSVKLNSIENKNIDLLRSYRTIGESDLKTRLEQMKNG